MEHGRQTATLPKWVLGVSLAEWMAQKKFKLYNYHKNGLPKKFKVHELRKSGVGGTLHFPPPFLVGLANFHPMQLQLTSSEEALAQQHGLNCSNVPKSLKLTQGGNESNIRPSGVRLSGTRCATFSPRHPTRLGSVDDALTKHCTKQNATKATKGKQGMSFDFLTRTVLGTF